MEGKPPEAGHLWKKVSVLLIVAIVIAIVIIAVLLARPESEGEEEWWDRVYITDYDCQDTTDPLFGYSIAVTSYVIWNTDTRTADVAVVQILSSSIPTPPGPSGYLVEGNSHRLISDEHEHSACDDYRGVKIVDVDW